MFRTNNDKTAISILNDKGQQIFTQQFNDKNTTQTVDTIENIWKKFSKPEIVAEVNGIGKPFTDLLKDRKIKVIDWLTTNKSKNDFVSHLQVAFEQGKISILPDETQDGELSYYEATYNPKTRIVTYNAPRGLHDDTVIALGLSYEAYLNANKVGNYTLGYVRSRY